MPSRPGFALVAVLALFAGLALSAALVARLPVPSPETVVLATAPAPQPPRPGAGPPQVTIIPPIIGMVRMEASGEAVFTGTAEPGARIEIVQGTSSLGAATADTAGAFTLALDQPLSPGTHVLALRATARDGSFQLLSDARWTLLVPERPPDGAAAQAATQPEAPPAETNTAPPAATPGPPAAAPPAVTVTPGIAAPGVSAQARRTVTVQPGDSLWTIAKATLGDGGAWDDIYRANRAQIRNPRQLYPGQVLVIPKPRRPPRD